MRASPGAIVGLTAGRSMTFEWRWSGGLWDNYNACMEDSECGRYTVVRECMCVNPHYLIVLRNLDLGNLKAVKHEGFQHSRFFCHPSPRNTNYPSINFIVGHSILPPPLLPFQMLLWDNFSIEVPGQNTAFSPYSHLVVKNFSV